LTTKNTPEVAPIKRPEVAQLDDVTTNVDALTDEGLPEIVVPKTVSFEDFQKLQATNARLLEESKSHKRQKQKLEEERLLAEGNKDQVIENLRGEITSYREREELDNIAIALETEASKRNCPDWDLMYGATGHGAVKYDRESGTVRGVTEFFDRCEMDERLNRIYFKGTKAVKTDNHTPVVENVTSFHSDPMGYLMMIREKHPERYEETVRKMQREGLIH